MEKNNSMVVTGGVGLVVALLIGYMSYNLGMEKGAQSMHMGMMQMEEKITEERGPKPSMNHEDMTMREMTKGLEGLKGDAFDKAFVEMMIVHHQGAVDMAKAIPENAKHAELKKLGEEIIRAQTKEIEMMKGWLKSWGYDKEGMMNHMEEMDHSMMGM
jgi:uncharacterized protein (DUF305 family)